MMNNKSPLIAVIYSRVSSDKQVDGYSLDAQEAIMRKYAKSHNMKIVKVFREEGKSARYRETRSCYIEMLSYIEENKVDVLLTHKLDRMSRSERDTFNDMNYIINELGIRYIAVGENMDSSEDGFDLKMGMQTIINANFSRNLGKETRKGLLAGAENCQFLGGTPPYGFKVCTDNGTLEIDETTAPAVKKIFELYADGFSASEICKWLKDNNYKTSKGNDFKPNALNTILHNEKYCGVYTWDKAKPKDANGHRNSHAVKDEYIRIDGGCPQIISKKLFAKAKERLKENSSKAGRAKPKRYYPLNGRIYCAECGARMSGNVQYSKGRSYYQYRCSDRCGCRTIRAEALEQAVFETLGNALFSTPNINKTLSAINDISAKTTNENNKEYQQLKSKLTGVDTAENNILKVIEKTGKAKKTLMNRLETLKNEKEQINAKINTLNREKHSFHEADIINLKDYFVSYMQTNNTINAKYLINSTISKVEVSNEDVYIKLADGISVDKNTKNILNKELTTMKNKEIMVEVILVKAEGNSNGELNCNFIVRPQMQTCYTSSCDLIMSEDDLYGLAKQCECEYFELFGKKFNMTIEVGKTSKVVKLEAA